MNGNWLVTVTAVVIAVLGLFAGLNLINGGGHGYFEADDASEIAASFSANYSGFFGEDYYLDEDLCFKDLASDNYPNDSGEIYTHNFVTFVINHNQKESRDSFNDYKDILVRSMDNPDTDANMGSVGSMFKFDDGFAVYSNYADHSTMHFIGYIGNLEFDTYAYLKGKTITGAEVKEFADAIYDAIMNPLPVDMAKKYPADSAVLRLSATEFALV